MCVVRVAMDGIFFQNEISVPVTSKVLSPGLHSCGIEEKEDR